ncbi:trypsin-like serine peptidase [Streptomyces virginiae]
MIHSTLPRTARRTRARRASRILLALAAMGALLGVDVPDAGPPVGVTAGAPAGATTDRVGAIFAGGPDGGHHCTASVVHSERGDVIATAAHCLESPDTTLFAPGYRDGKAPYGFWKLTGAYLAPGWTDGQDPDDDIAFATVAPVDGGRTEAVEDLVGGFGVAAEQPDAALVTIIGYPRSLDAPVRCANTTDLFSAAQRRIGCPDLTGGTSGSPWLVDGVLVGVLGGYEGGGSVPEVSYSAVLGERAAELYRQARS